MKQVLIFGTGKTAYNVINCMKDDIKIIAYIDNDKSKWGYKDYYPVISIGEIKNFDYDYIIIASQYEEEIFQQLKESNINEDKIIRFYKWFDYNNNYIEYEVNSYHNNSKYRGMVTGISYARAAILENLLKYKFVIVAFPSQDLRHDYKMAEYIIHNRHNNKIDYCLIGLSYYSFQYDLLKSSMKNKACFYNFIDSNTKRNEYNFKVEKEVFKEESFMDFTQENEFYKLNDNIKYEIGKKQSLLDCNKNYPETVVQNKQILKDYLKLLKNNNIRPIVVVCPAFKYYTQNFSKRIETEFHNIIKEIGEEYDFQYLDYFRSEEFKDEDFLDVSHLNIKGAEKFTNILNKVINW
ncbi:chemotaxis protein [Clostridium saccharoperbutylacetonicum]